MLSLPMPLSSSVKFTSPMVLYCAAPFLKLGTPMLHTELLLDSSSCGPGTIRESTLDPNVLT